MTFPHYFHLFGRQLHPHPVMELIAYTGGFQLYLWLRRRSRRLYPQRPAMPFEQNMWIIVGAIFGAVIGSKILAWLESPMDFLPHLHDPRAWLGGKTIVGGLLGGWAGVEIAKKCVGVRWSTGDLYVLPLIFGMAVGRVGCFLTGLEDHTCGNLTSIPWAINFGDGPRHPAQLYDIAFLLILGIVLFTTFSRRARPPRPEDQPADEASEASGRRSQPSPRNLSPPNGLLFRTFMLAYLIYRFLVEFLKPRYHPYFGLSAIQLACVVGLIVCAIQIRKIKRSAALISPGFTPVLINRLP